MLQQIESTTRSIRERTANFAPAVGIVLGTGLGGLVDEINVQHSIPYSEITDFPESTVPGHSGRLILGTMSGKKVIVMQGRFHIYEGYSMQQVTFPIRIMKALGATTLCVSNASGGVNPEFKVGDLMIINDHINLFPANPLIGVNIDSLGPRFVDMSDAYNKKYIATASQIAAENSIHIKHGVYAGLTGPCFETPAEYLWIRRMGADAVGMSTVPEVMVARHSGMQVFGISIITDLGIEGQVQRITHEEIQHFARQAEPKLTLIVKELVKRL
jgi:purine-nucleoside phosphorylase